MRLIVSFWECVCLTLVVASLPDAAAGATNDSANMAARYHCAGSAQLTGDTNLVTLNKILALPSAVDVEQLTLSRMSWLLADSFQPGTNASAASLLEPLLSDVLKTESLGSFSGFATHSRSFVVALRLDPKRVQLWRDNLGKALGGTGENFTTEEFNGWRWKTGASNSFWIVPARDWLLAGRGDDLLPVQTEYLRQVSRQGRPAPALTDNWLEADLDATCVAAWWPLLKPARVKISIATGTNNVYMTAHAVYTEALPWKSGSWQKPTKLVPTPLLSFTAGQDIAAFLNLDPVFSRLDGSPLTNQFFVWAQGQMPFLTYMAWPAAKPTNVLEKLSTNAPAAFNAELKRFNGTALTWQAKQKKLFLANLRVMAPTLEAVHDETGDFLLESSFPRMPMNKLAPDELWQQIDGNSNLVYYDWESTGLRLQQWLLLGRVLLTPSRAETEDVMDARQIADKWLEKLGPLIGNTVTKITRDAPNELSIVRSSPVGLTGIEMFLLGDWLSTVGSSPVNTRPPAH
jgi:hypothetical protein